VVGLSVPPPEATRAAISGSWTNSRKSSASDDRSGLFTAEVISTQTMPPLPSTGPLFGVMARTCNWPSWRAPEQLNTPPVK